MLPRLHCSCIGDALQPGSEVIVNACPWKEEEEEEEPPSHCYRAIWQVNRRNEFREEGHTEARIAFHTCTVLERHAKAKLKSESFSIPIPIQLLGSKDVSGQSHVC